MIIDGKVVCITGAAGRLGSAIARGIIGNGGRVLLMDVDSEGLQNLTDQFPTAAVQQFVGDFCSQEDVANCFNLGMQKFSKVDVLIHCAYPRFFGGDSAVVDLEKSNLDKYLSTHIGGAIMLAKYAIEFFEKQVGSGHLILISSIMGVRAPRFENYEGLNMGSSLEYTVSKAGLIAATQYLAKFHMKKNIRVNCISLGGILDHQPDLFLQRYKSMCNSKGMLESSDIVGTAIFLISDMSTCITGQNLIVDDGWTL